MSARARRSARSARRAARPDRIFTGVPTGLTSGSTRSSSRGRCRRARGTDLTPELGLARLVLGDRGKTERVAEGARQRHMDRVADEIGAIERYAGHHGAPAFREIADAAADERG